MKVVIKNPNEKPKFCHLDNTFNAIYKVIGSVFGALPIDNVILFFNLNVTDGEPNITVDNVQICGPIIITGSTPDGIETNLNKTHLKTIQKFNLLN